MKNEFILLYRVFYVNESISITNISILPYQILPSINYPSVDFYCLKSIVYNLLRKMNRVLLYGGLKYMERKDWRAMVNEYLHEIHSSQSIEEVNIDLIISLYKDNFERFERLYPLLVILIIESLIKNTFYSHLRKL